MNFQDLIKIETADEYLDIAIKRAKNRVEKLKQGNLGHDRLKKSKQIESVRINVVKDNLVNSLNKILTIFPSMRDLPMFYQEMIKCTLEYDELKLSLGIVNWAVKRINSFYGKYNSMINKTQEMEKINTYRRQFYGRVSSVMKQTSKSLKVIENARRIMKDYPNVKTSLKTLSLVGFPNVGKTTLLYKLTGSKPEINSYAFTTTGINIGHIGAKLKKDRIQVLDTPGTLNRFDKMNNVEKIAYLAMKYVSDAFVFVFDLSESAYSIKEQKDLFQIVKMMKKPMICYMSKTDITDKEKIKDFKIECIKSVSVLEKEIKALMKNIIKEDTV